MDLVAGHSVSQCRHFHTVQLGKLFEIRTQSYLLVPAQILCHAIITQAMQVLFELRTVLFKSRIWIGLNLS